MSENVRGQFSATEDEKWANDMLVDIMACYRAATKPGEIVTLRQEYRRVASELAEISGKPWTWRYIASVLSGTLEPSTYLQTAVTELWKQVQHEPRLVPAPVCALCGVVHTYDCTRETVKPKTVPRGAPKKAYRYDTLKIRKDDAVSAARSMRKLMPPAVLAATVKELLREMELEY